MRGKEQMNAEIVTSIRITPAYAGKSSCPNRPYQQRQDHPRLCGEKSACTRVSLQWIGSPPPMRGKAETFAVTDFFIGITPAYAGKSGMGLVYTQSEQDHPRLCGEKQKCSSLSEIPYGSPPPMRGKEYLWRHDKKNGGITPAYAGKSPRSPAATGTIRDHPRLCGEKQSDPQ